MAPGQLRFRAMVCSAIIVTVSQSLLFLPVSCGRMILTNLQHNGKGSRNSMDDSWVSLHGWMGTHFERTNRVSGALGSKPPRCENKCGACIPCEATQVPTTVRGLQYANYEPEGWKCKCGASFFNP